MYLLALSFFVHFHLFVTVMVKPLFHRFGLRIFHFFSRLCRAAGKVWILTNPGRIICWSFQHSSFVSFRLVFNSVFCLCIWNIDNTCVIMCGCVHRKGPAECRCYPSCFLFFQHSIFLWQYIRFFLQKQVKNYREYILGRTEIQDHLLVSFLSNHYFEFVKMRKSWNNLAKI